MADFPNLSNNQSIPLAGTSPADNALGLFNPDSSLSGTLRGTQHVGSPGTRIDAANNQILLGNIAFDGNAGSINVRNNNQQQLLNIGATTTDNSNGFTAFDSSGIRRILIGQYPDGSTKMKLSQATFDVATATDDQLIWSSDFNSFKIYRKGTVSLAGATAGSTNKVTLTLTGYNKVPVCIAFIPLSNYSTQLPSFNLSSAPGTGGAVISFIIDHNAYQSGTDGKVDFETTNFSSGNDPNLYAITYYILQETSL